jgi:serine/threonine protein kinase
MAEVFRAHDQLLARDVAVKVFRAHTDPDEATGGVQRQELELQTLARLSHPNLITLFDGSIGSDGEPAFLVMELISGPSLAAQIAQAPLTEPEAREIAVQIAGALAYVHSQHMVHRDIKPANILLGADGTTGESTVRARLSDFGIVRLLGSEHLTSADFMVGTASYLAPEQARGAEVGPAADIYALGLVLIEALTGQRSYQGPALEAVLARLDRSPEIPAGLPRPWPELLTAMTLMDAEQRPSAAEVARALREGVVNPVPAGNAVLAGDAVLAAGAPLAAAAGVAAAGVAGAAGLAGAAGMPENALADAVLVPSAAGSPPPVQAAGPPAFGAAPAGQPGFGDGQPGFGDAPELPTAYIPAAGLAPMPPASDDHVDHLTPDDQYDERRSGRGPLVGALVAGAAVIAALAAGGLVLANGSSSKKPGVLPGQSVSSGSSRQPVSGTPSRSATSVAPIGSVPTSAAGSTSSGRPSSSAPSSSSAPPSSSSAAPSSSAPPTRSTSAPASSAQPPSSSAAPTTSTAPSVSTSSSTTPGPAGGTGTSGTATSTASPASAPGPGTGTANPQQHG